LYVIEQLMSIEPVKKPAILKNHVGNPHEQCPPPLLASYRNAIGTDVLVASVDAAHVAVILPY
jgi:hypothetical protein